MSKSNAQKAKEAAEREAKAKEAKAGTNDAGGAANGGTGLLGTTQTEPKFGEPGYVLKPGDPGYGDAGSGPDDNSSLNSDDEPEADEPRPTDQSDELIYKQPGETNLPGSLGQGGIREG